MDKTWAYMDHGKLRFYQVQHYKRDFPVLDLHKELTPYIDNKAGISAQNNLVPALAFRPNIRLFPDTTGVQFIVYNPSESNAYPLKSEVFKARIDTFLLMGTFRIKSQSEVLVVLEKL